MIVNIWHGDALVCTKDLHTEKRNGELYIRWQGELRKIHHENDVWLTGYPPRTKKTSVAANASGEQLTSAPLDLSPQADPFRQDVLHSEQSAHPAASSEVQVQPENLAGTFSEKNQCGLIADIGQQKVIRAPVSERMLVNAGPGSGKTAVACARVDYLIKEGACEPHQICLLGFSRTAVAEIRDRINRMLVDSGAVNSIFIHTLDSFAWSLNKGFNNAAALEKSFNENIKIATKLICEHQGVQGFLGEIRHIFIDEAQDILGLRRDFVAALLDSLPSASGFTVFSDDAQAIYGFSAKDHKNIRNPKQILPDLLRKQEKITSEIDLKKIFRTSSSGLVEIFSNVRSKVLEPCSDPRSKYDSVCQMLRNNANTWEDKEFDPMALEDDSDTFVLFRTKDEVLKALEMLEGRPYRLRMGSLEREHKDGQGDERHWVIVPWIGAVLGGIGQPRVSAAEFSTLWDERKMDSAFPKLEKGAAFDKLLEISASRTTLDMATLRNNLTRFKLPPDLIRLEPGRGGPIIGTIHAAKGREAKAVYLYLPQPGAKGKPTDYEEEARVLFVGATRGKEFLHIGKGFRNPRNKLMLSDGYVDPETLAGWGFFHQVSDVKRAQSRMLQLASLLEKNPAPLSLYASLKDDRYEVKEDEDNLLCFLSDTAKNKIREKTKSLPKKIENLWLRDIRTVAISDNDSCIQTLHEPWKRGKILLAPCFNGFI